MRQKATAGLKTFGWTWKLHAAPTAANRTLLGVFEQWQRGSPAQAMGTTPESGRGSSMRPQPTRTSIQCGS